MDQASSQRVIGVLLDQIDSQKATIARLEAENKKLRAITGTASTGDSVLSSIPADLDFTDFNEETATKLAVARVKGCKDERMKKMLAAVMVHMHNLVREVEPTEGEWIGAIEFLTAVGHMCGDRRQEFILLSDVLGVSSLVELITHRKPSGASSSTVLGPFHLAGAAVLPMGSTICQKSDDVGEEMICSGRIIDTYGNPVQGAVLDVWHADSEGYYDIQLDGEKTDYRGKFVTGADGAYSFRSIKMRYYPIPNDGPVGQLLETMQHHPYRPAHLHFLISAKGFEPLTTHIFPDDDPYIDNDVVFGVKKDLVKKFHKQEQPGHGCNGPHWTVNHDFTLASAAADSLGADASFDPKDFVPKGSASNFGKN